MASESGEPAPMQVKKLPKWYIKTIEEGIIQQQPESSVDGERRSQRLKQKNSACVNLALMSGVLSNEEPKTYEEASQNVACRKAMEEECNSIIKN